MDDPKWLRLVTIGLVLAALAVGYFLFTGKFSGNVIKKGSQANASPTATSVLGQSTQLSPVPTFVPTQTPSAYTNIVNRAQGGTQALPNTGFSVGLAVVFSASTMIIGWGLRKFPK